MGRHTFFALWCACYNLVDLHVLITNENLLCISMVGLYKVGRVVYRDGVDSWGFCGGVRADAVNQVNAATSSADYE